MHYRGLESDVFKKYLDSSTDEEEVKKLQDRKVNLIDEFRALHNFSLLGIEKALKLIESKSNTIDTDSQP